MTTDIKNYLTVAVLLENIPALTKRVLKIADKAAKLGAKIGLTVAPEIQNTVLANGALRQTQMVTVFGEEPVIAGFKFIGALTHLGEAGNVLRLIPGETVPEKYKSTSPDLCEHCGYKRQRKETYLLKAVDGTKFMQVGSACLKDFAGGHGDPKAVLALFASMLEAFEAAQSSGGGGMRETTRFDLLRFLSQVAAEVRRDGKFITATQAREEQGTSTGEIAFNAMLDATLEDATDVTLEDKALAEAAQEFVLTEFANDTTDFGHNIFTVAKFGAVGFKEKGIAAYIIGAFLRDKAKQAKAKALPNVVDLTLTSGERMNFEITVTGVSSFEGQFGMTTVFKMDTTVNGKNGRLVWFCTGNCGGMKLGEKFSVMATVQDSKVYNGISETRVNRVKVLKQVA